MKKIITAILLSAILLTACGSDKPAEENTAEANASTAAAETTLPEVTIPDVTTVATEKIAAEVIDEELFAEVAQNDEFVDALFGGYVENTENIRVIEGEQSEKLVESLRNIHINNSRLALPMPVMSLPEGFTVDNYSDGDAAGLDNFVMYDASLNYEGNFCANVYILQIKGTEKEYGVIFGMTAMSNFCKWDLNGIGLTQDAEKMLEVLGEPSSVEAIGGMVMSTIYFDEKGNMILFPLIVNGMCVMSVDFSSILENGALAKYVPYDDFDNMPEIPELSGEPREIDWNMFCEDDCIVIGNEKYPVNVKISDLGEDVTLYEYSSGECENSDYIEDIYILMYKGREIAMVNAIRGKDEEPGDANMSTWTFTDLDNVPVTGSFCGISFRQDFSKVSEVYKNASGEPPIYKYEGFIEDDGEKYRCMITLGQSLVFVTMDPRSANPELYDKFANAQNEGE